MQGFNIDCTSAGSIQESLRVLRQAGEDKVILDILQLQVVRPMKVSTSSLERRHVEKDVGTTLASTFANCFPQALAASPSISVMCGLPHFRGAW